jgi:hypothetical protein
MWRQLAPSRPTQQAAQARPTRSRDELRRELARIGAMESLAKQSYAAQTAIDVAIDRAVEEHQTAAGEIQRKLEVTADPAAREALRSNLDTINEALDSKCKTLRDRAGQLQAEAVSTIQATPSRQAIEYQLIQSANEKLRCAHFHATQTSEWLEARRKTAQKMVAASQSGGNVDYGDVRLWTHEVEQLQAEHESARQEADNIRAEMLQS